MRKTLRQLVFSDPAVVTRRYHGLLIAALAAPFDRTMMLNAVTEQLLLEIEAAPKIHNGFSWVS